MRHETRVTAACDSCESVNVSRMNASSSAYGVATISRPLKIIGLFCRISSLL